MSLLRAAVLPQFPRSIRLLSQSVSSQPEPSTSAIPPSTRAQYPYFVPRNTQGNLPVYTDVRNNGGRYHILLRNVDGNVNVLAKELTSSLFPKGSEEASRIKIEINRSKHLVISGGRWKNHVVEWLNEKGF
ncbi:mitochondrial large subunit ribosomal protein-domain-containing protein [Crassisporium funariophilum]|nr:mitochondrial large subunit ribosomal protein-domain-containing protein [Crassisporium funariophilum]